MSFSPLLNLSCTCTVAQAGCKIAAHTFPATHATELQQDHQDQQKADARVGEPQIDSKSLVRLRIPKKKQGPGGPGYHNRGKFGREKKTGETTWVHYSKVYSLHASTGVCKAVLPERSCSSEAASFLES